MASSSARPSPPPPAACTGASACRQSAAVIWRLNLIRREIARRRENLRRRIAALSAPSGGRSHLCFAGPHRGTSIAPAAARNGPMVVAVRAVGNQGNPPAGENNGGGNPQRRRRVLVVPGGGRVVVVLRVQAPPVPPLPAKRPFSDVYGEEEAAEEELHRQRQTRTFLMDKEAEEEALRRERLTIDFMGVGCTPYRGGGGRRRPDGKEALRRERMTIDFMGAEGVGCKPFRGGGGRRRPDADDGNGGGVEGNGYNCNFDLV